MDIRKKTILCIDDDAFTLSSLNDILDDEYQVVLALDPEVGLSLAIKNPPDLIILDVNMPKITGLELAEMFRKVESTKHLPIIFLSAYDTSLELQKAQKIGVQAFLGKPCLTSKVRETVADVLKNFPIIHESSNSTV